MSTSNCKIRVQTGDGFGESTYANVYIILYDENKVASPEYKINGWFNSDCFNVVLPCNFGRAVMIEIWRDKFGFFPECYLVNLKVEQVGKKTSIFPVFRWIETDNGENNCRILELDTVLPQVDPNHKQRSKEIEDARELYDIKYVQGMLIVSKELPWHERFTAKYTIRLALEKEKNAILNWFKKLIVRHLTSLDDLHKLYSLARPEPQSANFWKDDFWFGNQRLVGCNPSLITLCTEIPERFGVTECMMKPVLLEETLDSLIKQKRLFLTDLAILDGVKHRKGFETCAPMALFMLDDTMQLLPIAIQLNQEKGPENPVFLPTDDENVWLMAKLWYNNADAAYHQSVLHLGWTHFLMEGVYLALRRNVSISHPIFKLLAPHTLFLLAINVLATSTLLPKGGWVDSSMNIGVSGMYELVSKTHGKWRFDLHGTPPAEFKSRNVEDPKVLPNYHFRDDSLLIYDNIRNFVTDYVHLYYEKDQDVLEDWEMQNWAKDLATDKCKGGFGIGGVPERDGKGGFNTRDDLIMVVSAVIYNCSAGHGAVNFPQYDEYAYPPNYPSQMSGKLIKDKEPRSDDDILRALPDVKITLDVMLFTELLSTKATESLGKFEYQYIYDPEAVKLVHKFRADLLEAGTKIEERNKPLKFPYVLLHPNHIPNAISI